MQRRTFVATSTAASLASVLARPIRALGAATEKNGIGLQLWTVRNQLTNDVSGTLKAVVDAGYKQVELMNIAESADIVRTAKDLGLEVRSAFFNWETIAVPSNSNAPAIEKLIDSAKEYGLEYMVFGYIGKQARDTSDKLKGIADRTNAAAEKVHAAGMKLSYHNHAFEFEKLDNGKTGFEIFMEGFDPQLVNFELDVFWAAIGGWAPIDTMKKLGKRLGQIHLKDLKAGQGTIYDEGKVPNDAFQEVGNGILDMKSIVQLATDYGVTQFHVEQDQSPDPIASIGQSSRYVKTIW
ncbi:MAG: sugar phosphate isomerase/epimerase [Planctomycetales bacterium]|nr:sugar phosphate isomerase/epimerase [Planctomycetales bacterium]